MPEQAQGTLRGLQVLCCDSGDRTLLGTALEQGSAQHLSLTHCTTFLPQKQGKPAALAGLEWVCLVSCPLPIKALKGLHSLSKTKVSAVHRSLPIAKNVCLSCCYPRDPQCCSCQSRGVKAATLKALSALQSCAGVYKPAHKTHSRLEGKQGPQAFEAENRSFYFVNKETFFFLLAEVY